MPFNSLAFLIFFPVVTIAYFLLPHRFRWMLLLAASCYFYMTFVPKYILILCAIITVDYWAGVGLERFQGLQRRWILTAGVAINLGMLAFFKYFNFANENLAALARLLDWNYSLPVLSVLLPIGLSFRTFQSLSYLIEVYRGHQKAERHFGYLALYIMYYPQLVAGPIERPQNLLPQLHAEHRFEYQRVTDGLKWMAWGMFKKVVIADRMLSFVNPIYDNPNNYQGPALVFATFAFAIQIYCDFSGYSDIALGAAQVMGVRLTKNFDHPYFAQSIPEFWRRWHISLSNWLRDYVFYPVQRGLMRSGYARWIVLVTAPMVTMLVSGLWHGASWTYVVWGGLHGLYFVISALTESLRERLSVLFRLEKVVGLKTVLSTLITFSLVTFSWIFFRAASLADALYIIGHLTSGWRPFLRVSWGSLMDGFQEAAHGGGFYASLDSLFRIPALLTEQSRTSIVLTTSALIILLLAELLQYRSNFLEKLHQQPVYVRQVIYASLIVVILLFGTAYVSKQQAFIYFQF